MDEDESVVGGGSLCGERSAMPRAGRVLAVAKFGGRTPIGAVALRRLGLNYGPRWRPLEPL